MTLFNSMIQRSLLPHPASRTGIIGLMILALMIIQLPLVAQAAASTDSINLKISLTKSTVISGQTTKINIEATRPDKTTWKDAVDYATFTTTDPLGSIKGNTYLAGRSGTWVIEARLGSSTATVKIAVTPGKVSHLIINPNSMPEVVGIDRPAQFTATAYDANNNVVPNVAVVWSLSGSIGSVSQAGVVNATRQGEGRLTASIGSVTGAVNLAARPAIQGAPRPAATPTNVNSQTQPTANANLGGVLGAATETSADDASTAQSTCWNIRWWGWLAIMIGFLAMLYGYYMLIESKITLWIWIIPILLTAGLIALYFFVRCGQTAVWFPWVTIAGGLIITLFRPIKFVPTNGQSI